MNTQCLINWLSGCMLLIALCGCGNDPSGTGQTAGNPALAKPAVQVAFLADIHLHDFIAAAEQLDAAALPVVNSDENGRPTAVLMRSMQAQLNSTRLFNENYYVLRAALDDIAAKGIKLVALPGDFSDDGQPANVKALARILDEYTQNHGMRFFAMNGNHDPTRPYTRAGGKTDFLDADGKEVAVMSPDHPDCINGTAWQCSEELREWGYEGISRALINHGFAPSDSDKLYETPFGTTDLSKRGWQWCEKDDAQDCIFMPDTSYLVEPQEGIWLLAIDANVYEPDGRLSEQKFKGSGNAGYNALLEYKPELVEWIADVVQRAKAKGKRLVAFSHFPMADFYDNTQPEIADLFGRTGMQLKRMPTAETTKALADTGLRLHMAGHMHIYDVNAPQSGTGLVNVQVPSLAAYQPGYSLVTFNADHTASVETIIQTHVPHFDTLFSIYYKEWVHRRQTGLPAWDRGVLNSKSYLAFTDAHLREVVRQRYVGREWPAELAKFITGHTLGEVLMLAGGNQAKALAEVAMQDLPAITLAYDYYRIRNAGQFADLNGRETVYQRLSESIADDDKAQSETKTQIKQFLRLLSTASQRRDQTQISVTGV